MAKIERVEIFMVDLAPKVRRTDATQCFLSQETPIVRVTDADGAIGVGYSYTIGSGGPSVVALLEKTLAPMLIGREADQIEGRWHDMLFATHATAVGTITSLAIAAIDTTSCVMRDGTTVAYASPAGTRAKSTVYQNTSGKIRMVTILAFGAAQNDTMTCYVGVANPPTVTVAAFVTEETPAYCVGTVSFMVPPSYYYKDL